MHIQTNIYIYINILLYTLYPHAHIHKLKRKQNEKKLKKLFDDDNDDESWKNWNEMHTYTQARTISISMVGNWQWTFAKSLKEEANEMRKREALQTVHITELVMRKVHTFH